MEYRELISILEWLNDILVLWLDGQVEVKGLANLRHIGLRGGNEKHRSVASSGE